MVQWFRKTALRASVAIALALLGLQGFIVWADMAMETLFFDEVGTMLITGLLAWIVKRQRDLYNAYMQQKETD